MQVDLFDPTSKVPCVLGEICGVAGMTFHGAIIPQGQCIIVMACMKKWLVKIPFSNEGCSKIRNMVKGIVMWREKDFACK